MFKLSANNQYSVINEFGNNDVIFNKCSGSVVFGLSLCASIQNQISDLSTNNYNLEEFLEEELAGNYYSLTGQYHYEVEYLFIYIYTKTKIFKIIFF